MTQLVLGGNLSMILSTVEPRFNDLRYNDIPAITIYIRLPSKSFSKMYGAEPWYNDLRYNDIPGLTVGMLLTQRKSYNYKNNVTDGRKCYYSQYSITKKFLLH